MINRKRRAARTRVRMKLHNKSNRMRMTVFISNCHIYSQVIDDTSGNVLLAASTLSMKADSSSKPNYSNAACAVRLGQEIAKKCKEASIEKIIFDKGAKRYHGVVKAFAESARSSGLDF
ncbi:50S ribosomal protein L18 [Candidatus Fokinia solitaria]|uniref:Large ribosomal subunit protein uL18 n=1 Tax=Candidatus Fokinia solitaria TaxID=1802984 RepID=A0A2U8BRE6_9RICK|nr:50S ribosomal protein L18 [Candidatus Fokinia solitaria]AWD32840.1 50S ribosomal protein L18 [Candidatus Fokinia solitaria]